MRMRRFFCRAHRKRRTRPRPSASVRHPVVVFQVLVLEILAAPVVTVPPQLVVDHRYVVVALLVVLPDLPVKHQRQLCHVLGVVLPSLHRPAVGVIDTVLAEFVRDGEIHPERRLHLVAVYFHNTKFLSC